MLLLESREAQQIDRTARAKLNAPVICENIQTDKMKRIEEKLGAKSKLIFNVQDSLVGSENNSGFDKVTIVDVEKCTMIDQILREISKYPSLMVFVFNANDELGCFSAITVTANTATGRDDTQENQLFRWEFTSRN